MKAYSRGGSELAKQLQANIELKKQLVTMEKQRNLEDDNTCGEMRNKWVMPYLVVDIMFSIFTRPPARKLKKLRYCCKEWYMLISSSRFISVHLHHSKPGLIAIPLDMTLGRKEGSRYVHPDFIRIKGKKVSNRSLRIKSRKLVGSSCNGLLLLEDLVGNVSVSNPVTGQMLTLPRCNQWGKPLDIKRGIAFVDSTKEYKVVSLVINGTGSIGCEMLVLGSSTWKWVSSPLGRLYNGSLAPQKPVSIRGVVHFMLNGCFEVGVAEDTRYMVSFDTVEEKFYKSGVPYMNTEVLHEIDGCPSILVPNLEFRCEFRYTRWDMLTLKDLSKGECEKQYCIDLTRFSSKLPRHSYYLFVVVTLENGRFFILERDREINLTTKFMMSSCNN